METPVLVALIAAGSTILASAVTYALTRRREREADWRKFKLGFYREYVEAISGVMGDNETPESRRRFTDAANNLTLVASPAVLREAAALVHTMDDPSSTQATFDAAVGRLLRTIREDAHPEPPDDSGVAFKLFSPSAS